MSQDTSITITIPTYNRVETLLRCVSAILPQLTGDCTLVILDNASPVPAQEVLEKIIPPQLATQIQYVRNRCNVGGNANITRCFEQAVKGWLWILGDDDLPLPNALEVIRQAVAAHTEACVITFHVEGIDMALTRGLQTPVVSTGMHEYLGRHSLMAQSLISASVYNVDRLHRYLPDAYQNVYTMYPHLSLTLLAMQEQRPRATAVTLPQSIVGYSNDGNPNDAAGDRMLPFVERAQNLRDLLPDAKSIKLWEQSDFGRFLSSYDRKSSSRIRWIDIFLAAAFSHDQQSVRLIRRAALAASAKFKSSWILSGLFPLGGQAVSFALAIVGGTLLGPALRALWCLKSRDRLAVPYRVKNVGVKSFQNIMER